MLTVSWLTRQAFYRHFLAVDKLKALVLQSLNSQAGVQYGRAF